MGLNDSIYVQMTDTELQELDDRTYRATMRLYDAAGVTREQMTALPSAQSGEYRALQRRASVLMAAGREAGDLHSEVARERRERRESVRLARQAEISALAAAYQPVPVIGGHAYPRTVHLPARAEDFDQAAFDELVAIDAADRRDDPLMREN